MTFKKNLTEFSNIGFTKINNCLNDKFLLKINYLILNKIYNKKINKNKLSDCSEDFRKFFSKKKNSNDLFSIQNQIYNELDKSNILEEILNTPKIYDFLIRMLGSDLEYKKNNEFIINTSINKKKNYLFKKLHQEVWSGASTNTILIWIPLFQKKTEGQMRLVKQSHLWGHIPHHDKSPIKIPKNSEFSLSNCKIGDVIFFHTLTLHGTIPLTGKNNAVGRLSLAVRNFKYPKNGFEDLNNWTKFSYSPHTIIEKQLGNPYLSPFRLSNKNILKNSWKNKFK